MTQLYIKLDLDNDANPSVLKKMLSNMKGVVKVSINKTPFTKTSKEKQKKDFIDKINKLTGSIDPTQLDITDERTLHIMRGSETLSNLTK